MTSVRTSLVDVYVLRGKGASLACLVLRRGKGGRCPGSWETVHGTIEPGETPAGARIGPGQTDERENRTPGQIEDAELETALRNAEALSIKDAAILIPESELTPQRLADTAAQLLNDPACLQAMGAYRPILDQSRTRIVLTAGTVGVLAPPLVVADIGIPPQLESPTWSAACTSRA